MPELDEAMQSLAGGAAALRRMTLDQRRELIVRCIDGVVDVADQWVEAACAAKRIPADSPARAEEVTTGPVAAVRCLQLFSRTLKDVVETGRPRLPFAVVHEHGQCRVPVFPTGQLYDALLFRPMTAATWLDPRVDPEDVSLESTERLLDQDRAAELVVVLGAGNVSAIPVTDALTKIFIDGSAVMLKMNPVNDYLGSFFEAALKPLVDAKLLHIAYGGVETGQFLIAHGATNGVHITGSIHSHDAIVWGTGPDSEQRRRDGRPVLEKSITSELGNVTPWAIVPGRYSERQLRAQAETIATSIINNASFNCIATKLILTSRKWPQRQRFFEMIDHIFSTTTRRHAYYPGAVERFEKFSQRRPDDPDKLPWTLLRDIDPQQSPHLLREESFTCVCGELVIDASSDVEFLDQAVDIMNDQIWGTLAAALTVSKEFESTRAPQLDAALRKLRFGTIGINQWPALSFALMSPPWGGHPGTDLADAQSGIGFVHNTFLLDHPEKTVLRSPLRMMPKPIWYSNHRHPERVVWDLLKLYHRPGWTRLPKLFLSSLTG